MSAKKTATKKQPNAQKPAKPAKNKAAFAAKMAKAREAKAEERQSGPCPKGGEHEFALDDEGDNVCMKCLEPGPKAKGRMPKAPGNLPRNGDAALIRMPRHVLDGAKAKVKRQGETGWTLELLEQRGEAYPAGATVNAGSEECVLDPEAPAKPKREPKPVGETQLSALDAAAKVLEERGQPMNTRQLIEVMSQQGYWTSPGSKTP